MSITAYGSGNSLKDIVENCAAKASRPEIALDPATKLPPIDGFIRNALGYRWLLDIIRNLYLSWDWPFAITARTLSQISPQCLTLPTDFWRVAYTNPLYGLKSEASGDPQRFAINHISRADFFDNPQLAQSSRRAQPENFYISRSDQLVYLDPPPDQSYAYELHYFRLIPEATGVNEIPQFPHKNYLQQALLCEIYDYADDSRIVSAVAMRNQTWQEIRGSAYDMREDNSQSSIPMLDPRFFTNVCFDD